MMSKFNWFKSEKKGATLKEEEETAMEVFRVIIPENCEPGQQFQTMVGDRIVLVRCPPSGRPGEALSITVPKRAQNTAFQQYEQPSFPPIHEPPPPRPRSTNKDTELFEVAVPPGVQPGHSFSLIAGGQRILVACPLNARTGDKIRFNVPKQLLVRPKIEDGVAKMRLKYNKDGWARNVRLTDMKFQWVRMDDKGEVVLNQRFDIDRSAYVRKLRFLHSREGLRTGILSLVPAADAVVDSCIKSSDGRDIITYTDLAAAQVLPFEDKVKWFHETCDDFLKIKWEAGHMQINIRRNTLTVDSLNAILTMSRRELRKYWKFCFLGEEGIDAGGLAREWFQLVTEDLFDSEIGLFQPSAVNQMCSQINPVSGTS